ncbi:lipocalin-like domain-containing protein [Sphingomonas sp. NIBR02145]|uniref:lipocalin-like domain-containing protein n=1 Tax=Sphingomonas sp. NIBR02145 TaxID=3014784 RepID=UPI0022B59D52|nr:lipocalin-like domain-containing protein [Sphingomonas sp. NIBR02145]WHU03394.1 lipocalin-like domain-containing protein [Sphingomonas sp. NIBR02145]
MVKQLILAAGMVAAAGSGDARVTDEAPSLAGTWVMDSAYEILADGRRVTNYGEHPLGLLIVDSAGRYSLQIFRRDRPAFATGDKARGTPEEFRAAALGSSTHFGRVRIDAAAKQLVFDVEGASFPNWEGRRQVRDYALQDRLLRYAVPASASGNGTTAYSIWRRVREGGGDG